MTNIKEYILIATKASSCKEIDIIQSLWSGYGKISRYQLEGSERNSVIVKNIIFPNKGNHPRGWNTNISHKRKVKSYEVESFFYKNYNYLCNDSCRTPIFIGSKMIGSERIIILEDLDDSGFSVRKSHLNLKNIKICLSWLANFHGIFLNKKPDLLWEIGTYWNLNTRPEEFKAMNNSSLKKVAIDIDTLLNDCKYQTFVHGDAKVENFCFSKDLKNVAAVDFQYVGGGCGMKDVAYLMGSCLSENDCKFYENELLDYYFIELNKALIKRNSFHDFESLESEWRSLYDFACADFSRFLMGWMPTHQKLNNYSKNKVEGAILRLSNN